MLDHLHTSYICGKMRPLHHIRQSGFGEANGSMVLFSFIFPQYRALKRHNNRNLSTRTLLQLRTKFWRLFASRCIREAFADASLSIFKRKKEEESKGYRNARFHMKLDTQLFVFRSWGES